MDRYYQCPSSASIWTLSGKSVLENSSTLVVDGCLGPGQKDTPSSGMSLVAVLDIGVVAVTVFYTP